MRILCIAAILAAGPGFAETYDSGGVAHGTTANEAMPIAEGHVMIKSITTYESFEVPAGHPLEGASGNCFGAVEIKDTVVSGSGACVYDVASGDKAAMTWQATGMGEDGALTGDYTISGGSGAWATATGSGTFSSLTNPDTGKFANTITGSLTLE